MADIPQDDFELPGVPDSFQRLWTPHRLAYVKGGQEQYAGDGRDPFCVAPDRSDEESQIVRRGETCYVIMNLFPYNAGHLLVCPYEHISLYTETSEAQMLEMGELTKQCMWTLTKVANPGGFNIGMNQGAVGGAGIAQHLHQHVVPRWGGDSNFLPIIAQTKAITQTLGDMRTQLADNWATSAPEGEAAAGTRAVPESSTESESVEVAGD